LVTLIGRRLFTVRARRLQTAFGKIRFGWPNGVIGCRRRQIYFAVSEWFMAVLTTQNPLRHLHRSEGQPRGTIILMVSSRTSYTTKVPFTTKALLAPRFAFPSFIPLWRPPASYLYAPARRDTAQLSLVLTAVRPSRFVTDFKRPVQIARPLSCP
jgi:hypothetical protein